MNPIGRPPRIPGSYVKDLPEYSSWKQMKYRCLTSTADNYERYGGRGITIYQEWIDSFEAFFNYVGEKPSLEHTLDRIDNSKGYYPGNVKWSTKEEQANNKNNNVRISYDGKNMTVTEWARYLGMNQQTLLKRLELNWPIEKALKPFQRRRDIDLSKYKMEDIEEIIFI